MVEQLIRNQQVVGSSPIFSSKSPVLIKQGFYCIYFTKFDNICQETLSFNTFRVESHNYIVILRDDVTHRPLIYLIKYFYS